MRACSSSATSSRRVWARPTSNGSRRLAQRFDVVANATIWSWSTPNFSCAPGKPAMPSRCSKSRSFQPWEGGEGRVLGAWDHARAALGLPIADPPLSLGEGRPLYEAPVARHADGEIDYFATSLPDLLLFFES